MKEYIPHITRRGVLLVARSSGIALVSAALLVFMGIKINTVTASIVKAHGERSAFTAKFEQFDKLKKDAESVADAMTQLNAVLPTMDTMPAVVDYINTLGARTGTTVAVQFDSNAHAGGTGALDGINFVMQANGQLTSILDLLKKIENAPYLINIKTVGVSLTDPATNQVAIQTTGIVYIQSPSQ